MKRILPLFFLLSIVKLGIAQTESPLKFTIVKNLEATDVKSQGNTGTCWSFSTTSFIESEILRKTGKKKDLSEMFVVRKIYMEKALLYLRYHGHASFSQGALSHDFFYVLKKYGMMPEEIYSGKMNGTSHNHVELEKSLKNYLDSIVSKPIIPKDWSIRFDQILDSFLGACPPVFQYENAIYNASTYGASLGVYADDYIGLTSYTHHPYYSFFDLEIPDNYSHGQYLNVPMEQLIEAIVFSLNNGYTIEWDGDVSEPGFARKGGAATLLNQIINDTNSIEIIPTQELRQSTFDSHETTDDHLMHITGMATDQKGTRYFITKNSWGDKAGINGYVYMSENYVKLKTLSIFIHKNQIPKSIKSHMEDLLYLPSRPIK